MSILIATDGATEPNPGPGAWAAIVRYPGQDDLELTGFEPHTTNNRMELLGPISGLEHCAGEIDDIVVVSDSKYVIQGITAWIKTWKRSGWTNSARKPVVNRDLWERLDALNARHSVTWRWVRGHSGHRDNERADFLAVKCLCLNTGKTRDELFKWRDKWGRRSA